VGKPRRGDHRAPGPEQHETHPETDLDPRPGHHRDPSRQIRRGVCVPPRIVQRRAGGAQLIVEMVELREPYFAGVARFRFRERRRPALPEQRDGAGVRRPRPVPEQGDAAVGQERRPPSVLHGAVGDHEPQGLPLLLLQPAVLQQRAQLLVASPPEGRALHVLPLQRRVPRALGRRRLLLPFLLPVRLQVRVRAVPEHEAGLDGGVRGHEGAPQRTEGGVLVPPQPVLVVVAVLVAVAVVVLRVAPVDGSVLCGPVAFASLATLSVAAAFSSFLLLLRAVESDDSVQDAHGTLEVAEGHRGSAR